MNEVDIRVAEWRSTNALRDIRQTVFIDEQHVPPELEWDAEDARATHFLLTVEHAPVGTARLLPDGHIGRVALLSQARSKGLGQQLMRAVMAYARQQGMARLQLSAQTHALGFYSQLGFVTCSNVYPEAGIPHQDMSWEPATSDPS
ncbi:Predicted N-acyltransferase, GNAT family [Halopseudomonas litoralis]|uniref:Predicted N-acyltransferase, GNAT family n=1 Tax=Halopseudomonas litoralis TaxID=797277 RepID=A0A1H1R7E2_9GAMM|nr:GNAT family N-acetyltransferase [Halopseudomonas litoralis]SDS31426.1 Predicted N-acyltransferase, GNAT family [Halopseudomonas litoralis]